jgi:hypothetical protein
VKAGKPVAFVMLAFLVGGIASQLPFAFADSSANPLQSIWDAINALSHKQEDLQNQVDELRDAINKDHEVPVQQSVQKSDASVKFELEGGDQPSYTAIHLKVSNAGPDSAVGVKVTLFYEMTLFQIDSMNEQCKDLSRGIIQCFIGTIAANEEYPITIIASAKAMGERSDIVADISSITSDADSGNNHASSQFVTGELARNIGTNLIQASPGETNHLAQNQTADNSNSTQAGGSNQIDQSTSEAAGNQTQGSDNQNSTSQNSENTTNNSDNGTSQGNQTQSSSDSSQDQQPQQQGDRQRDDEGSESSQNASESGGSTGSRQSNQTGTN